jgi:hypothetical protein
MFQLHRLPPRVVPKSENCNPDDAEWPLGQDLMPFLFGS